MGQQLVLVGGGLANGLIALRLAELRPELDVRVIEAGPTLGGNHTWSFHDSDLSAEQRRWIAPLVVQRWPGYEVRFPGFKRRLPLGYASISSDRFADVVGGALGQRVHYGQPAVALTPTSVTLADGRQFNADAVIDGRGIGRSEDFASDALVLGFQKFVGLEVRTEAPHGLTEPILMDATLQQIDGYRFFYVLPLAADRLLVEDTYYSDAKELPREALRDRVLAYARQQGFQIAAIEREEAGVLPIALAGDIERFLDAQNPGLPRSGLRAGLFHPVTGYSLPEAVRLADRIAALPSFDLATVREATRSASLERWRRDKFLRLLGRMLFLAGEPALRWKVMARFYTLNESLIRNFYAGQSTLADKVRLSCGKPPVPFFAGLACIPASSAHRARK